MKSKRSALFTLGGLAAAVALSVAVLIALPGAATAAWPDKPIRWVVEYAAGGGSDFWFTLRCAPEAQFA